MQTNQLFMLHPKMQGRRKPMRRASVDECSRAVALGVTSHCLTCDDAHKHLHIKSERRLEFDILARAVSLSVRSCLASHQLLPPSASTQGHRIRAKSLLNKYSLKISCFVVDLLHARPVFWNRRACSWNSYPGCTCCFNGVTLTIESSSV